MENELTRASAVTPSQQLVNRATRRLAPPPRLTVSEWADAHRVLSSESGAAAGRWKTLPFQREVFDAFSDPSVHTVVLMTATQMIKTVTIENCLGYLIDNDPGPVLLVLPRDSDCDKFSKIRLSPMVRDTPSLRANVQDVVTKRTGDTLSYKRFPGGFLSIAAAGSPGNLAALPIRFLMCDEIDKYPSTSGSEGDPISLAYKRQGTFWNRKTVLCCSPTISGESRIEKAYLRSDQRVYQVPCPRCGGFQVLRWPQVRFESKGTDAERAASAVYACESCGASLDDQNRWRAVESGRWTATTAFNGTAGFWISELYSPWKRLSDIVMDFLTKRKDPHQLQTFVNTSLAECWKLQGEAPDWERLYARRESYELGLVPRGGLFLTAAVDVQRDRLEIEVCAWGRGRESWSVDYRIIPGDPTNTSAIGPWWRLGGLHELLTSDWLTESGGSLRILCMSIDSGDRPQPVYDFARRHPQPVHGPAGLQCPSYGVVAVVKGTDASDKIITSVSNVDVARQQRGGVRIFHVGTHFGKQELYDLLRLEPISGEDGQPPTYPSGYCHSPQYDRSYFQGLTAETRVVRASGKIEWVLDPSVRNEPLDLRVYNRAAAAIAGIDRFRETDWQRLEERTQPRPSQQGDGSAPTTTPGTTTPDTTQPSASVARPILGPVIRPIRGRF